MIWGGRRGLLSAVLLGVSAVSASAQGYLLRLDSRTQSVAYRGVMLDSIPAGSVVPGPNGGLETPDGYAVSCAPGAANCEFYRPGLEQRGGQLVMGEDLTVWGYGLRGLSLHANARIGLDLGAVDVWPGTNPAVQLLEGYLDYSREWISGRVGRQVVRGRLGYSGFDGGLLSASHRPSGLSGEVYIGLGLARGVALPVTAPALNPLDDFQPRKRQLVAGANGAWQFSRGDLRVEYQREVDRDIRNFVSERVALSASLRPVAGWHLSGGADYDIARALWGTADAQVSYSRRRWGATAGGRRYRPYFDLWTIWGVFSPVPYTALDGSFWVTPVPRVDVHGSGERYWYADPEADAPLQTVEEKGWRWSGGVGVAFNDRWSGGADYQREFGPGASSTGWSLNVSWQPSVRFALNATGGRQVRPLEFRYDQSEIFWVGLRADIQPIERLKLSANATRYDEDRQRPDASAFSWNQVRLVASVSWLLGSGGDQQRLPPPVRRPGER
jgi:hypothetical protein